MIKVTGLWKNQKRDGEDYLAGTLGTAKILIFRNKYKKEGSNEPDYNLYVAEKQRDNAGGGGTPDNDDIPF